MDKFKATGSFAYINVFFLGKEIITHRQILIKIADDSDMGWKTVKEYEVNPLVEDSGDEKRL